MRTRAPRNRGETAARALWRLRLRRRGYADARYGNRYARERLGDGVVVAGRVRGTAPSTTTRKPSAGGVTGHPRITGGRDSRRPRGRPYTARVGGGRGTRGSARPVRGGHGGSGVRRDITDATTTAHRSRGPPDSAVPRPRGWRGTAGFARPQARQDLPDVLAPVTRLGSLAS